MSYPWSHGDWSQRWRHYQAQGHPTASEVGDCGPKLKERASQDEIVNLNSSFVDEHYHQNKGVAKGTKMGPNYACLYVGFIEEKIFNQYQGVFPFWLEPLDIYNPYWGQ